MYQEIKWADKIKKAVQVSYWVFNKKFRHLKLSEEEKQHFLLNNTFALLKREYDKEIIKQFI